MLSIACVWALLGQMRSTERLTYGELRALVPVDLRPVAGDPAAWNLLVQIKNLATTPPHEPFDPVAPTQVSDLLVEWNGKRGPDLVRRSRERLTLEAPKMDLVERALRAGSWAAPHGPDKKYPVFSDLELEESSVLVALKNTTNLFVLRSLVAAEEGDGAGAVQGLNTARSIGERLSAGGGTVINCLVGFASLAIANDATRRLANHPALTASQRASLARSMPVFDGFAALRASCLGEFDRMILTFIGSIPSMYEKKPAPWIRAVLQGHPKPLDIRATLGKAVEVWRAQLEHMKHPDRATPDPRALILEYSSSIPSALRGNVWDSPTAPKNLPVHKMHDRLMKVSNPVGRARLHALLESSVLDGDEQPLLTAAKRNKASERLTGLILAANAYHLRTGKWPAKLTDLGPEDGIDKPLLDPFSNEPFKFDPARLLVWSVAPPGYSALVAPLSFSVVTGIVSK
ncbi:hypothetical protein [Fimbriimonas ginsengisoli]|uniref:Uncharacterized protein n=1 Tax=Fimbriimonas ginsengisoli Gsoil 348 TaxID=661478 RepID=A0A068NMD4_FIMGI|nr:hypothetical protein [Fimbriimonas ginsengisoli]AIE84611.1 hypothetical protein OP10G_1243 [Fimbriimonas ginsengisoli Gsoil 348]